MIIVKEVWDVMDRYSILYKNFISTAQYLLGVDSVKVTSEKDIEEDQEVYNTWVPGKADDDIHSNGRRNNEVR